MISSNSDQNLTNRRSILLGFSAMVAGVSGCSSLSESAGSLPIGLEDITIVNALDGRCIGSIEVINPDSERVLNKQFDAEGGADLPPNGDIDEKHVAQYNDVLSTSGTYTVSVAIDEESKVEGTPELNADISVSKPDKENLMIAIGGEEPAEPIAIAVVEKIGDLSDWNSCAAGCQ
ncbi:hypothetical protein [Haloarcula argentinensis]|nr:hypothetical protein [Haloarcula argentinensis]MDS0255775.1 hypothetical protein [Haloarcula argentinensis]